MNRRSKPTRYVSIILLLCFTVTSSYGTVGLQTTPLSNLGNDLKYDGADKWWLRQMVAQADSELFEFSTQHFDEDSNRVIAGDTLPQ